MNKLRALWQQNRLLVSAFAISVAVMMFFAVRFISFAIYWHDPAHQNQALEPWMTLRYVAHSWHVPHDELARKLGFEPGQGDGGGPKPLDKIAEDRGVAYADFKTQVNEAVQQLLKERPAK